MSIVRLRGEEALHYAEAHDLRVNKAAAGGEPAREGLTVEEAREIVSQNPDLIWLEIQAAVNTGDEED